MYKLDSSDCPVMVDQVAAFTIPCCVHGYHVVFVATMYTNACGLHLLERSLLPSGTQIMQVIATQNTDVNIHAAHCAALALRGIPCVIFLIMHHFPILRRNLCKCYF